MFSGGSNSGHVPVHSSFDAQPPRSASTTGNLKRPKACVGCRESKLRCKVNEGSSKFACERCVNAGRECIIPVARKRTMKAGKATVAVLERKIDALVASLAERKGESEGIEGEGIVQHDVANSDGTELFSGTSGLRGMNRTRGLSEDVHAGMLPSTGPSLTSPEKGDVMSRKRTQKEDQKLFSFFVPRVARTDELFQKDVIHRGLVSLEDAEKVFNRFTKLMLPHFPVIALPEGTTVSNLRRTKPTLFLAILGSASAILGQEAQKLLTREVMNAYADRVLVRGERDLDLVQALQISVLWYYPPEHYEEVKIYQLIHVVAVMSLDLGFDQEGQPSASRLPSLGVATSSRPVHGNTPSAEILAERQRAWLGCYFLCSIASMVMRRPCMLRWAPYMDRCIASLESARDALDSDKLLCQWVRGQRIAEEIGQQFFMDDPSARIDASDMKVQYVLRGFEQRLDRWRAQIPVKVQNLGNSVTLPISVSVINLYLHEFALHDRHNINDFKPPFVEELIRRPASVQRPQTPTPTQLNSLAICVVSARNILDIFLGFDAEMLCSIPVFNFVRTVYAVVVLMKMHLMVLRPDDDHSTIINKEELQAELYLQRLLASLQVMVQTKKLRLASMVHLVLQMLQLWFQQQCRRGDMASGEEHTVLRHPDEPRFDGSDHLGRDDETFTRIGGVGSDGDIFMPSVSEEAGFSDIGAGLPKPGLEAADWMGVAFATLFEADGGRLFETALELLGLP